MRLIDAYEIPADDLLSDVRDFCQGAPQINDLIYAALDRVARQFLDEIPSRARLHASTLEYTVFTNCMDSHVWFEDERLEERFEEWRRV